MKKIILGFAVLALLALPAVGQDKEQDRVEKAGTVIKEIMDIPDDVPQDVIDRADCVVVLPSVLKFALGIGGSYGRGVMTRLRALNAADKAVATRPRGSPRQLGRAAVPPRRLPVISSRKKLTNPRRTSTSDTLSSRFWPVCVSLRGGG